MKKGKILYTCILFSVIIILIFTACKSEKNNSTATNPTTDSQITSTIIHATDYTYSPIVEITEKDETQYVHTVPPVPTFENKTNIEENNTEKTNENGTDKTTNKIVINDKVEDRYKDLTLITKTSPVLRGNSATVIIQGTPDAEYTIDFYKNSSSKANYQGLGKLKSDSLGFVSWTFTVENDCEIGERKIIVKEINSDKFIQTSITVQ